MDGRKRLRPGHPLKFHQLYTPSSMPRPCLRQQPQQAALHVAFLSVSQDSCVPEGLSLVPKSRRCFFCQLTAERWLGRDACPSHQLAESTVASWPRISISIVSLSFPIKKGHPSASCAPHPMLALSPACNPLHPPCGAVFCWLSPGHCASGSHGNQRGRVS